MPCYTRVQTVLIDIPTIERAAKALGMTVTRHNANRITIRKDNRGLSLGRSTAEGRFVTESEPDEAILKPLLQQYARLRVRDFATRKGYTVAVGDKAGVYVLSRYE